MGIHTHSKSSLFLTEMILSILFFSIAAACCIQIFVKGYQISQHSENLSYGQNLASSMAEVMMVSEGNKKDILQVFPSAEITEHTVTVFYDRSWHPCEQMDASFVLKSTFTKTADTISGEIQVFGNTDTPEKEGDSIFKLPFRQHIAKSMSKEK